uniref:(northern house mosquito) hypothetical protein n=1 Tax=Culex pipiens TaxID=7175 RepID=A0A8D8AY71_CULPI
MRLHRSHFSLWRFTLRWWHTVPTVPHWPAPPPQSIQPNPVRPPDRSAALSCRCRSPRIRCCFVAKLAAILAAFGACCVASRAPAAPSALASRAGSCRTKPTGPWWTFSGTGGSIRAPLAFGRRPAAAARRLFAARPLAPFWVLTLSRLGAGPRRCGPFRRRICFPRWNSS